MVDETGKNLGLLPIDRAIQIADERNLNLVEVSPNAVPPVCKLIDYGKYRYELSRQERKARAHQKEIEIKEIRLSYKLAEHDREVRLDRARGFLTKGNKVKIDMRLRGREQMFAAEAIQSVLAFRQDLGLSTVLEQEPKKFGNRIVAVIAPSRQTQSQQLPIKPPVSPARGGQAEEIV